MAKLKEKKPGEFVSITIRLDPDFHRNAKVLCARAGVSFSDIFRDGIAKLEKDLARKAAKSSE